MLSLEIEPKYLDPLELPTDEQLVKIHDELTTLIEGDEPIEYCLTDLPLPDDSETELRYVPHFPTFR